MQLKLPQVDYFEQATWMDIETAELELYLRKYKWALKDLVRELGEGCKLLRTMPDPQVQKFLLYMKQLSEAEQFELARAIVKSSYFPAINLLGEALTEEDQARLSLFKAETKNIALPTSTGGSATKTFAVKRTDVAKTLLPILSSAFGEKPEKSASLQWFYTTIAGDWRFHTELDLGGTWGTEIRCFHRLVRADSRSWGFVPIILHSTASSVKIPQFFSLLSLYGLSGGIYHIHNLDDVRDAAKLIVTIQNHLLQAALVWIDQLTIG